MFSFLRLSALSFGLRSATGKTKRLAIAHRGSLLARTFCFFLALTSLSYGQIDITASEASEEEFLLGTGAASYSFTITGTTPGATKNEAEVKPYYYFVYATGLDIYGNRFFQPLQQGRTQVLYGPVTPPGDGAAAEATSQTIAGQFAWGPNDSTLLNSFPLRVPPQTGAAHQIVLALYGDGNPSTPPSEPPLDDEALASPSLSSSAGAVYFFTDSGPDLAIDEVTFNAGSYTGGDIIRMTTKWRNNSFPITPGEVYKIHNYLTENAAIDWRPPTDPLVPDDSVRADNDDFLLSEYTIAGDRPVVSPIDRTPITPDGTSVVRKVEAIPLGPLVPYGIPNRNAAAAPNSFYGSTLRVYQPQPADGFLDVNEVVSVTVEVKVPENYAGTYFVAGRVDPENTVPEPPELRYVDSGLFLEIQPVSASVSSRRPDNNSFVSNASAKLTIDGPTTSPTVEAVSAIAFQDGEYVQGGGETSNQSAVSSDGNVIAFSSAARNLMVPPPLAQAFIVSFGRGADMTQSPIFDGSLPFGRIGDYLTFGQQIFYRLRQTRENYLASGLDGIAANANCFNPSISSATGQYVAFDSRANNLGAANTGNRSLIYITDVQRQGITAIRPDADGDSFNPSISANGRFVSFESLATNLDPDKPIPAGNNSQQIYLHDRDVDGNGTFDEIGNTATYLVSVNSSGQVATATCLTPALSAWEPSRTEQDFMYVAYTSFARNLPSGGKGEQVYRVKVKIGTNSPGFESVDLVSINNADVSANKPQGAPNGSIEPSINGDGSQVAFSSSADNLVFNSATGAYNGDTNLVPDVFVRDFKNGQTVRVSESIERVATGVISFVGPSLRVPGNSSLVNIPQNNPQPGDTLRITSGGVDKTFVFGSAPGDVGIPTVDVSFPRPVGVLIGQDVCTTRDNLVSAINSAFEDVVVASATTPTAVPGATAPNMAITASIYLRSLVLGETGNGTISFTGVDPVVVDTDLTGGGVQAEDAPLAVQGVPAGSDQPSISEDGRVVAFRTIAGNLDVQKLTLENDFAGGPPFTDIYPPSPQQGELVRPVRFPASNVYVRNRSVDKSLDSGDFDLPGNVSTTKISVNNFGYPTTVSAQQSSGIGALTTAANQTPAVGGDGRIISFSSGSEAFGGLVFGRNNLEPLDFQNARDVYIYDSQIVGVAPPPTESRPAVDLLSPINGLLVQTGSTIALAASVVPKLGKTVSSVQFFVNGAAFGPPLTSEPYSLTYQLTNPGQYIVRVVATDSRGITGLDSAIIKAGPPPEGQEPPLVAVTQPASQLVNYVVGSDLMFNANAQDLDGEVTDVTFYLAGTPIPAAKGFDNNWYAPYRPFKTGSFTFFASATDNDGNTSLTEVATINFASPAASFPSVEVVATNAGLPAVAGGVYPLRARITGPVPGIIYTPSNSFVLFYADGVYLGLGGLQADGTFLLDWNVPSTPRTYGKIYAYLESPNFFTTVNDIVTLFSSVVVRSKNFLTLTTEEGLPLSVSLIKPTNGAQIPAGVGTLLEATALAPAGQGTISRVEFYQNGELIDAADEAFPYQIQFTPAAPGRYELVALAYSTAGVIEQSAPITVTAVQGIAPTVALQVTGGIGSIPVGSPELEAVQSGNQILLTMNAMNGVNYVLEETTNLSSDLWTASSAVLTVDSDQSGMAEGYTRMQASVPIVGGRKFFRLSYPTTAGDNFSVNQTATLEATANDSDGTVARVEFLVNGVVVETDASFPYRFSYLLTAPGRYEIVARAYDDLGNVTDSASQVVLVTEGARPTTSITNPSNTEPLTEVTPGIPVSVTVEARDADGSVVQVELLVNGVVVGLSTQAPFIFTDAGQFAGGTNTTFTPTSEGLYSIVARATDNLGNVTDSERVTVRAKSPTPVGLAPSVQITQPIGEIYYVTGSSLFLNARATDAAPGTVDPDSVEFTVNGLALPGAVVARVGDGYGVRYTPTASFTIDTIRAQATDNDGNTTYSQPNYVVLNLAQSPLPQVQMLKMLPGQPQDAGGEVTLRAEALFPPTANQQARVEFYANNVYAGTAIQDLVNPRLYTLAWETPADAGSYAVEARAVALNFATNTEDDNAIEYFGSVISDNSVAVNTTPGNAPVVTISSPTAGQAINANQPFTLRATASVPSNVSIVPPPQAVGLSVTSVPVVAGDVVAVNDPLYFVSFFGSSVAVRSALAGEVTEVKIKQGDVVTSGLVTMSISVPGAGGTIDRVEFYTNGDLVGADETAPYEATFTPESVGLYNMAALAYSDAGLVGISEVVSVSSVLGTPPAVTLSGPTQAVLGQTTRLVATPSVLQAGRNIQQVEFLVNNLVVATLTAANDGSSYAYDWPVTAPGIYQVQARAIDNVQNIAFSNVLDLTSRVAPAVLLDAPTSGVIGQTITLSATVTNPTGGPVSSVQFLVNNNVIATDSVAPYSANYTIPTAGTYDLQARAIDTDGVAGLSNLIALDVPAPPPPDPTAPSVTIIDPTAGANVLVGSSVNLVAVASPGDNATVTSVVFNVEDPAGSITSRVASQSGASYLAAFTPAIEGLYTITASVTNNRGQTATAFVGVIAQTALPVPPGTDAAFVIDMYQKILGREPTGTELVTGTDELAVPDFTRADFVYNMLMGSEYANVQNRVADFFFTLGVAPTRASFAGSVATTRSNTSLMTGFDDYYPGVSQFWASPPPFGATFGQVSAAQSVVASSLVKALDNTSLTQWMFNRLGGATASPSEVTSRLVAYSGAEQRGAAVSFLTANYENIGGLSPSLASAQQGYQYQLRATAVRFLLGGPWQATGSTGTVLAPVSRLSHLEVSTPLGLLSFIERLVGDTEVVLVAPGSASATASAILGGSVTNVVVTPNGSNYTTPPSVVFEAPRFTTALATPNLGANGAVTSVTLSNSTNGHYLSAPAVSLGINGSGALATAMAEVGTGATAGRVTNIRVTAPGSGYTSGLAWVRVDSPSPWQASSGSVGLSNGQITSVSVAEGGMGYPTTNPAVLVGAPQALQGSTNAAVNFSARRFTNASLVNVSSFQLLVNGRPVATNANVSAPAFTFTPVIGTNRISVRAMNGNFVVGESDWTELVVP